MIKIDKEVERFDEFNSNIVGFPWPNLNEKVDYSVRMVVCKLLNWPTLSAIRSSFRGSIWESINYED